jgi:hypothetical protein
MRLTAGAGLERTTPVRSTAAFPADRGRSLSACTPANKTATYFRNRLNSQYDGGDAFDDRTIQASTAARRIPMAARAFFVGVRGRL